ncbi:maleylpyruvate isomerase family mycothiol-dependent enzyme [Streptomyces sp. P6-2-1]|uniref:maleylpyruvate isomerase family mycothiol-dependent enzyme n=1 Tax=Streptomyces sp. P6-2-1 TaxID=3422591 RepID=UPI003D35A440
MARTPAQARDWAEAGIALLRAAAGPGDARLAGPSLLPGWTRAHVVAHVAANADALGNLAHWAATGEPTPMYASPDERAEGIARGAELPPADLVAWLGSSAAALGRAMDALGPEQWSAPVVTAQGRTVPATELPWMRAREVCVHAVDLGTDIGFDALPAPFLAALCEDIAAKRSAAPGPAVRLYADDTAHAFTLTGGGEAVEVRGPLAALTAWLAGRPHPLTTTTAGALLPDLGPWL